MINNIEEHEKAISRAEYLFNRLEQYGALNYQDEEELNDLVNDITIYEDKIYGYHFDAV